MELTTGIHAGAHCPHVWAAKRSNRSRTVAAWWLQCISIRAKGLRAVFRNRSNRSRFTAFSPLPPVNTSVLLVAELALAKDRYSFKLSGSYATIATFPQSPRLLLLLLLRFRQVAVFAA